MYHTSTINEIYEWYEMYEPWSASAWTRSRCNVMKRASLSACNGIYYENCRRRNYERWRRRYPTPWTREGTRIMHADVVSRRKITRSVNYNRESRKRHRVQTSDFISYEWSEGKNEGKRILRPRREMLAVLRRQHSSLLHDTMGKTYKCVHKYREFLWSPSLNRRAGRHVKIVKRFS